MTPAQLQAISRNAAVYYKELQAVFTKFNILTPRRQAAFIAQCAHESAGFKVFVENLNYSAQGLVATWPGRFYLGTPVKGKRDAAQYARQPAKIANAVYGGRLGNGDEASGDGALYPGRGPMMTTGADNYAIVSYALFRDRSVLLKNPKLLELPEHGFTAAGIFWHDNGLNALADAGDFRTITLRINGGLTGYDDNDRSDMDTRMDWYVVALKALGVPT